MDEARKELIRESYPDNERTHFIAEAMNTEFDRGVELGLSDIERNNKMNIEGAIAALAFETEVDYEDPDQRRLLIHDVDKYGSIAEDRRVLENESYTDDLTKLRNSKAFKLALSHTARDGETAYITMDMDNFGLINKIKGLGWTGGDRALVHVADHLRFVSSQFEIEERNIFHLHGDEFAMTVPTERADEILAAIEQTFGDDDSGEQIYESEHGKTITSITGVVVDDWEKADDALNEKKTQKKSQQIGLIPS